MELIAKRILQLGVVLYPLLVTLGAQQDVERVRQQRQKRQEQELGRLQQERSRGLQMTASALADVARFAPIVRTESCLARAMVPDPTVDVQQIPLSEWLEAGDKSQIPWRVDVDKLELRTDQRYEVGYSGSIELKDLDWSDDTADLQFATGISGGDGEWVTPPKIGRRVYESRAAAEPRIMFGDCVFLRPGEYNLVIAAFDSASGKHSLMQRRIHRTDFSDEPLPALDSKLPMASFPESDEDHIDYPETQPPVLTLPVATNRSFSIQVISALNFPAEWSDRPDFVRSATHRMLAATSVLSQLQLDKSSISATVVDLVNRTTLFDQQRIAELDWKKLAAAFPKPSDTSTISLTAMQTRKDRAAFFRQSVEDRLKPPADSMRVLIILSGATLFEGGSDLTPISVKGDCHCRVYYLHFLVGPTDSFNDLEKLLKRLRPKTYDIASPHDFRKALAELVNDLEML
jgi:hypothetical protein